MRTSEVAPHPAALLDINYATRWLKARGAEYRIAADAVGLIGFSSGGHLVMLAAMRPHAYADLVLKEAPDITGEVPFVIMGWPVIDPVARYHFAIERGRTQLIDRHHAYFGDEASMAEASPPRILERGEEVSLPPALIVQGAVDDALPRGSSEQFVETYSYAGGLIELGKYPAAGHGFIREGGPGARRALAQIKAFIARQIEAEESR
jgi:acetyl esterase/lipase